MGLFSKIGDFFEDLEPWQIALMAGAVAAPFALPALGVGAAGAAGAAGGAAAGGASGAALGGAAALTPELMGVTGATMGATLAFLVARYLASHWVEEKTGGRLKQLKQGVEAEGWRFVAFVRLVPLFPFNLLNYALGLTRIKLSHYVVASFVCMLPGGIAYTYLGYAGRETVAGGEGLLQKALLALSLLAAVAFMPRLIGRLRRGPTLGVDELKGRLDSHQDILVLDVRTAEDFVGEQHHIAGGVNIPLEELEQRLGELREYQERPVAIVCRTDRRSAKAAQLLAGNGYGDVHVVKGGMTAWNEHGYPVD